MVSKWWSFPCLPIMALALLLPGRAAAQAQPDLTISITSITNNYGAGSATYTIELCNLTEKVKTSLQALFYNLSSAPACGSIMPKPNHTWTETDLGPGECRVHVHTRTGVPLGSYTARAMADADCKVPESDETNNTASQAYSFLPDLRVALKINVSGTTVEYTLAVRNYGASTTQSFNLDLTYDQAIAPVCGEKGNRGWVISGLGYAQQVLQTYTRTSVPAGSYTAWAFVDNGCVVPESVEDNNQDHEAYQVGPDIRVYNPKIGVSGSTVDLEVQVCNQGPMATGTFAVALWYDQTATPTCATASPDHVWSVTSLPAAGSQGDCVILSHKRTDTPAGKYTAKILGDAACAVAEIDEGNNVGSGNYTVLPPEYFVDVFTATVNSTTVSFSITICNKGASSTIPFQLSLDYDAASEPTCNTAGDSAWTVNGLDSKTCVTKTHDRTSTPVGTYQAWAFVDGTCVVPEESEDNNTKSVSYAIAPTQPDLYVAAFSTVTSGSDVTFTAMVCNAGVTTTADLQVGFYYNPTTKVTCSLAPDFSYTVSGGLGASLCTLATHVRTNTPPGTYGGYALVDSTCVVTEFNENNNLGKSGYTVEPPQLPELSVETLDVTVVGSSVSFAAKVCNKGPGAAPASTVGLFLDRASAPSGACQDSPDATAQVGALAVAGCETKTWNLTNLAPGSFTGWAMADATCAVTEETETNNSTSQGYVVSSLPPDSGPPPQEAGAVDSGPDPDGWTVVDGAIIPLDSSTQSDLVSPLDAPPVVDGAPPVVDGAPPTTDGATASPDAGVSIHAEQGITPQGDGDQTESGCGCALGQAPDASWLGLLLGLGLLLRRRRR